MRRLTLFSLCGGMIAFGLAASAFAASAGNVDTGTQKWASEQLNGKIMMVDPNLNLLVIEAEGNVPFDMKITPSTKIRSGDRTLTLPQLKADMNQPVSVTFVPTRSRDMARAIHLNG